MKLLGKIFLFAGAFFVLVQIPFIYRSCQIHDLDNSIAELNKARVPTALQGFKTYKGVIHVHTNVGGHSTGRFEELIDAASENALDFVVVTEHASERFNSAELTLNGTFDGTLFVPGLEVSTADGDRLLIISNGLGKLTPQRLGTLDLLSEIETEDSLALVSHTERFVSWGAPVDGVETFSMHTAANDLDPIITFLDLPWSYRTHPGLMFARSFSRPDKNLADYDAATSSSESLLFGGNDAHSNIGFSLFSDETGRRLLNIKLDSYSLSLSLMRMHVLIPNEMEFSKATLIKALKKGRAYLAFDVLGDPSGFSLTAVSASSPDTKITMGDVLPADDVYRVIASSPIPARLVLLKDGSPIMDIPNTRLLSATTSPGPGVYRVEAYLDALGPPFDRMPWILSNPIYVR